ncbi:MAG: hypothetical protein OHK0052_01710 [Anaerolineales bacterium]
MSSTPVIETPLAEQPPAAPARGWLWQGKLRPAFWTISGVFSIALNVILIVVVLILAQQLFRIKQLVQDLVSGLNTNFVLMDEATIRASVMVNDTIRVNDTIPLQTDTAVLLTEDTFIPNARVSLRTGGLMINEAPTDIVLPAGTPLRIRLDLQVPIDIQVPVNLTVPVDIPLNQTELHQPFVGLQQVVSPYDALLSGLPDSWNAALCPSGEGLLCLFVTP